METKDTTTHTTENATNATNTEAREAVITPTVMDVIFELQQPDGFGQMYLSGLSLAIDTLIMEADEMEIETGRLLAILRTLTMLRTDVAAIVHATEPPKF